MITFQTLRRALCVSAASLLFGVAGATGARAQALTAGFTPGDLVVSLYGDGDAPEGDTTTYTDNEASPITLNELAFTGGAITTSTPALPVVGQLVLPQVASGTNNPISGEYGSSSEGTLELSANAQLLTIAGYDVNAATYDAGGANFGQSFGGGTKSCLGDANPCYPLAQTASVSGTPGSAGSGVTTAMVVPRVIAAISATGSVDTSTALTGVFNENNPRSVATVNGSTFYISGQGEKNDTTTQGLFVASDGATTPSGHIYNTVDTRTVSIQNNQLFLSSDSTEGAGVTENISSFGAAGSLPTGTTSPTILSTIKSKFTVTSLSQLNAYDQANLDSNPAFTTASKTKGIVYLSPENYFFANPTTLYVADSGDPKGDNNGTVGNPGVGVDGEQGVSDGGLQKWTFNGTAWVLDYTLTAGLLDLVPDTTACGSDEVGCGTTGLIGLTGQVEPDGTVDLFSTNSTLGDEDQTYLYGITDTLADTDPSEVTGESFDVLETAPSDVNIRGVAFAPETEEELPEPASLALFGVGAAGLALLRRKRAARR